VLEQEGIGPLRLDQWEFYVVPTQVLERRERSQHSITLTGLQGLAKKLTWTQPADAVGHQDEYLS
jgi:hypothetical protein